MVECRSIQSQTKEWNTLAVSASFILFFFSIEPVKLFPSETAFILVVMSTVRHDPPADGGDFHISYCSRCTKRE